MLAIVKRFMPGERIRMILIAACIGVMSGLASIVLREAVDLVHKVFFVWGYEALGIAEAGWRRLLLPLLPPAGIAAIALLPLLGWARLRMARHMLPEVVGGALLGLAFGAVPLLLR